MTSIRRWLLAALLAALAVAGLAAAAATYFSARDEVDTLLDEELRQVALSLRDHAVLDLRRLESVAANPDQRVLVQIWDPAFDRPYVSRIVGDGPMPRTAEGYVTLVHDGRSWRAFTLSTGRQLIQVAQPTALRTELAARTAWRLLVPVLFAAAVPRTRRLVDRRPRPRAARSHRQRREGTQPDGTDAGAE